jgi:hypothetical protein
LPPMDTGMAWTLAGEPCVPEGEAEVGLQQDRCPLDARRLLCQVRCGQTRIDFGVAPARLHVGEEGRSAKRGGELLEQSLHLGQMKPRIGIEIQGAVATPADCSVKPADPGSSEAPLQIFKA